MQMLTIGETARLYRSSRRTIDASRQAATRIEVRPLRARRRQLISLTPVPSSPSRVYLRAMREIFSPSAIADHARCPAGQVPSRHAVTSIPLFFADTVRTPISRVYHYERAQ